MSQQNVLGLAKQGNPKAIAILLNRSLKPKGMTAKAQLKQGCLHILLESAQVPNQQALVAFIRKGILSLGAESIKNVKVYWRQLGAESSAWNETIELKINDALRAEPMPSDQVTSSPALKSSNTSITQQVIPVSEERTEANPFINLKARHLFLWAIFISLLSGIGLVFLQIYSPINGEDPLVSFLLIILIDSWLYLWALGRFRKLQINHQRMIGNLPHNFLWLPTVGLVVALFLFSLGAFQVSHYFLSLVAPSLVESVLTQHRDLSASETAFPLLYNLLNIFVLVIVAPVTEELLFRGILLHRWATKWGLIAALLVSSLIFGFLHANFVGLSVFGLVMALLYLKTGTLIVPIVCHALNNAVAVVMGFIPLPSITGEPVSTLEQFRSNWWIGVVYVLLSAPWLIRFIYKTWPNQGSKLPYFTNAPQPRNHFAIANELLSNLNILADRPVRKSSSSETSLGKKR